MRTIRRTLFPVILLSLSLMQSALTYAEECHPPTVKHSAEFERLSKLVGQWEGDSTGAHEGKIVVDYKLTSGGSALVETLSPGSDHEMVSVYHDRKGKLAMTHYCMLGNQPELELVGVTNDSINLSLAKSSSIAPGELHMHALRITFIDDNTIVQRWGSEGDPKKGPPAIFRLRRKI